MKLSTYLSAIALLLIIGCAPKNQPATVEEEVVLGELQHNFDLDQAVKDKFDEGLLLLHNFEYEDALTAFEEARALDKDEVMISWGEAMCHYKALWRLQNLDDGRAIIERLGTTQEERLASIKDPIKKDMWEMVEIMYGDGEFEERNKRLAHHMATLHEKYPDHQEIAAFYALSLVWATEEYGNGSDDLRLAAAITDKITAVNPLHPGALHYKIHALDGPTSAADAHEAADAYAKVAADAAHALHMPSHIYLALGEWDGVVNSNDVSYAASINRMKKLKLGDGARGHHSLSWMHYGLLQQGRYAEAEKALQEILEYAPNDMTKNVRGYLLGMQSRHVAEVGELQPETQLDLDVKVDDIGLLAGSVRSYLRAQLAYQNKDISKLDEEIKWLAANIVMANEQIQEDGLEMCAAGLVRYAASEGDINTAETVMAQIQGLKAQIQGDDALFEKYMKKAVEHEDLTRYPTGPPNITQPSYEMYADWLLEKGRYKDALTQYEKALERMPRRAKSMSGKAAALEGLGDTAEAAKIKSELSAMLADAYQKVKGLGHS